MLPVSFLKEEDWELMVFVKPEYKPPSRRTTAKRVEKMNEESAAELSSLAAKEPDNI